MTKKAIVTAIIIFAIALIYRISGLQSDIPFWVDEFSTATQAQFFQEYGLEVFSTNEFFFEKNNFLTHLITAGSFELFGPSEQHARLPFVIIGAIVAAATYLFSKRWFNPTGGYVAAILYTFSYFMITWSLQARGYVLQQLVLLGAFCAYFSFVTSKKGKTKWFFLLLGISIVGVLTHMFFYIAIIAMIAHFILFKRSKLISFLKKPVHALASLILASTALLLLINQGFLHYIGSSMFGANNLWYYHAYLWRQYAFIIILALIGFGFGIVEKRKVTSLIGIYIFGHILFVTFFFGHNISKYLLPVFPFFFILAGYALERISFLFLSEHKSRFKNYKKMAIIFPILIGLFIVVNGNKFVQKPLTFYSLNNDFREISNIDYHAVYSIVEKRQVEYPDLAIVETWIDRPRWYLGINYPNIFLFRWENEDTIVSGHQRKTEYMVKDNKKIIPNNQRIGYIGNVRDLQKTMIEYPQGFIFIDDQSLPQDVLAFAENRLKKEIHIDSSAYEASTGQWPATLYSWGFEEQIEEATN